jgi:hypothetical protein
MGINTTGIKTTPNCAVPNNLTASTDGDVTILSATSVEGCSLQVDLNTNDVEELYGVINVPGCGTNTSNVAFQSVRQIPL